MTWFWEKRSLILPPTEDFQRSCPGFPGRHFRFGPVADRVAVTVRHKRELLALGCSVVEMEAGAVALAASDRNLPFYCIRVVSDTASESLPLDFNRFRDKSGRFNRGRIAAEALLRPTAVPRLLEFGRIARAASESLGEFLAQCKF